MTFLNDLSDALSTSIKDQFGLADNEPGDLDSTLGPQNIPYGKLGNFASQIDTTAQRKYLESGSIRNIRPRAMEIISQTPDVTVLIKKRLFSSLQENFKLDLLDRDELLFFRASKALFSRKCKEIAAYERLSKFANVAAANNGILSDYAFPAIFGAFDALEGLGVSVNGEIKSVVDTAKRVKLFSDPNVNTTWLTDQTVPFADPQGNGTGVIELTTVSGWNSTVSTKFGQGNASLTIEDPYKMMLITNKDIEAAISDATNLFKQNKFFLTGEIQLQNTIDQLKRNLNVRRATTGASPIRFIISENTILSKKVRAIIDEEGREINFEFDAGNFGLDIFSFNPDSVSIDPQAFEGRNGLQGEEIDLFKRIVNSMFTYAALKQTTRSQVLQYNEQTNKVRRKMRLHYANKPIIQPMDVVYIFVNSGKLTDPMVSKGLTNAFSGDNFSSKFNSVVGAIETSLDDIVSTFSGGSKTASYLENEKNAIAGPGFPMWLWNLMRNDFTQQKAGTSVFVGIVSGSSHSYEGGKYTLSVNVDDNAHYFEKSSINVNPSLDVSNGPLYDPLTPFKADFDLSTGLLTSEVPELLDNNVRLLNSESVKAKQGRNKGRIVNPKEYKPDVEYVSTGSGARSGALTKSFRKKFVDPDGFVYRWKEGIGSLVVAGGPFSNLGYLGSVEQQRSPSIFKDPFAGQDTMNVLSLLITGQPYDFNNFIRGAFGSSNIGKDFSNESAASTYFKGLVSDVTRNNAIWGNFIPFKKMVVNDQEFAFLTSGEFDQINADRELSQLLKKRANLLDQIRSASTNEENVSKYYKVGAGGSPSEGTTGDLVKLSALTSKIGQIDNEIQARRLDFEKKLGDTVNQTNEGTLQIIGNDISFDPSIVGDSTASGSDQPYNEEQRVQRRKQLRKNLNYLSLRRLWAVKGNEDRNFFIVDDIYDKNYDVQQFEKSLGQLRNFQSTFENPFGQIDNVRQILGLEVFADSQGHIRARPPHYNRIPSSVYRQMLQTRAQDGIKIFPEYLERLFFNTIDTIIDRLSIVEDKIRLLSAALGQIKDEDIARFLKASISSKGSSFQFLTREDTGLFGSTDVRSLFRQNQPDLEEETAGRALDSLNNLIKNSLNATVNFDIARRIDVVTNEELTSGSSVSDQNARIDKIYQRLFRLTRDYSLPKTRLAIFGSSRDRPTQTEVLKITNEIAQHLGERQRLIKRLAPAVKNLRQGISVNNPESFTAQSLLTPNLSDGGDQTYPEILEGMIEDETNHDLGPGSGSRFVIKESEIISFTLMEKEPPFNAIEVNGRLGNGIVPTTGGLEISDGGNAIASAWAVDYDLWQMYGLRQGNPVQAPFFSDPASQCAPYATYLLNLSREQIFTASLTVIGNEFIQAGEVYYIEDYDLLFYAESVSHSFSYNGTFTTSLTLTFGHNPGEYIPTQLDVIGKGLYSNRFQADVVRHERHNRADDSRNLGVVILDNTSVIYDNNNKNLQAVVTGRYGEQNRSTLANITSIAAGLVAPTTLGRTLGIEIRIYKNRVLGLTGSDAILRFADAIKSWITDPRKSFSGSDELLPDKSRPKIDANLINIVEVDLGEGVDDMVRSPSSAAWYAARNIVDSSDSYIQQITQLQQARADAVAGAETEAEIAGAEAAAEFTENVLSLELGKKDVKALQDNIIDIWAVFRDPDKIVSETSKT